MKTILLDSILFSQKSYFIEQLKKDCTHKKSMLKYLLRVIVYKVEASRTDKEGR